MPNANEWLEQRYPKNGVCQVDERFDFDGVIINNLWKTRSEITHLAISWQNLTDTLDLSDFTNLEILYCWKNELTELVLPNNDKLRTLDCGNNQITSLDLTNYVNLQVLKCFNNQLISLEINNCLKLELINVSNNQLTQLTLPITNQLEKIDTSNNYLTTFSYFCLNPATLRDLRLGNNNLLITNLSFFSHLVNLTHLIIGNYDHWMKTNLGNQFSGSLEPLKNLTKLEYLNIDNLELEIDFQYLPANLKVLWCSGRMLAELMFYGHNLQLWQAYHPHLMKAVNKEIIQLTDFNFQLKKQIRNPLHNIFKSPGITNYDQHFQYNSFFPQRFLSI